jgi:3-oxocholest-4-en-26-oyl-CoA dehydrogenase alpha subunit
MDFTNDSSDLLPEFRREVAEWLSEEMKPAKDYKWTAIWTTRADTEEYAFRLSLARKLGDKGWLYPAYPAEYGGAGLTHEHAMVVAEELAKYGLPWRVFYTISNIVAPTIYAHGDEQQRKEFLPPMLRGEVSVWQLLTEPQGGSDIATCRTVAVREGDFYRVNGQKVMVGSHHETHYLWTLVCTDPEGERHKNLSWLYIPADLEGVTFQEMHLMMGIKNAVFFDDVMVPARCLVGGENNGWKVSQTHMEVEHGGTGSISQEPGIEQLFRYCQETYRGGQRIIDEPESRRALAEIYIDAHVTRLFGLRNAWHHATRRPHQYGGSQYRFYQRMFRLRTARRMQDILGYTALMEDLSVHEADSFEHLSRSGPGWLHGAGTLDTDRVIMARRLGLGRRVPTQATATM